VWGLLTYETSYQSLLWSLLLLMCSRRDWTTGLQMWIFKAHLLIHYITSYKLNESDPGLYSGPGFYPKFYGKWIWILTKLQLGLSGVHYTNWNTKYIHHEWECVLYYGNEMNTWSKRRIYDRNEISIFDEYVGLLRHTNVYHALKTQVVYDTWSKLKNQQGNYKHQTLPPFCAPVSYFEY